VPDAIRRLFALADDETGPSIRTLPIDEYCAFDEGTDPRKPARPRHLE
jgi:hypothetical protein